MIWFITLGDKFTYALRKFESWNGRLDERTMQGPCMHNASREKHLSLRKRSFHIILYLSLFAHDLPSFSLLLDLINMTV